MAFGDCVQAKTAAAIGSNVDTTVVLTTPPVQGNLLVAFVAWNGTQTPTAAAGWTLCTVLASPDNACFAYKIAAASESATQEPLTLSGSATKGVSLLEYQGPFQASPLDVEDAQVQNGATKTTPGVDPVDGVQRLIVCAAVSDHGSGTSYSTQKIAGSTGGVTERTDFAGQGSVSQSVWDRVVASTAAGSYNGSASASPTDNGAAHIAIFASAATQTISPTGIASAEAVGAPALNPGAITISPSGIASASAVGVPVLFAGQVLSPVGIASTEAVGVPTLVPGAITLHPSGIPSSATVGVPSLSLAEFLQSISFRARPRDLSFRPEWPR